MADWLEAGAPHKHIEFNMDEYILPLDTQGNQVAFENACGAVCCIAGSAAQFFAPEETKESCMGKGLSGGSTVFEIARKALGLDIDSAQDLFVPENFDKSCVSPEDAGKVVRHLIKTGRVDWRIAGYS